ncbi:hypothetical protein [Xanthomonas albilineans]|uniref:hypothetical protein n=1 Tax=Xanthomonas albilineans TaxID=29447 RepID=UPI000A50EA92|nr:hypothetical protein [Xanthomonas albilineans]
MHGISIDEVMMTAFGHIDSPVIIALPTTHNFINLSFREESRENLYISGDPDILSELHPSNKKIISRSQAISIIDATSKSKHALLPIIFSFPDQITSHPNIQIFSSRNGLSRGFCAFEILATSKYGSTLFIWQGHEFVKIEKCASASTILYHLNNYLDHADNILKSTWLTSNLQPSRSMPKVMEEAIIHINHYQSLLAMNANNANDAIKAINSINNLEGIKENIENILRKTGCRT